MHFFLTKISLFSLVISLQIQVKFYSFFLLKTLREASALRFINQKDRFISHPPSTFSLFLNSKVLTTIFPLFLSVILSVMCSDLFRLLNYFFIINNLFKHNISFSFSSSKFQIELILSCIFLPFFRKIHIVLSHPIIIKNG